MNPDWLVMSVLKIICWAAIFITIKMAGKVRHQGNSLWFLIRTKMFHHPNMLAPCEKKQK